MPDCLHRQFACQVNVACVEDTGRFMADVTVKCEQCGTPFKFLGLPLGLDMNSATVSFDGCAACKAAAKADRHAAHCDYGYNDRDGTVSDCTCYLALCRAAVAKAKGEK